MMWRVGQGVDVLLLFVGNCSSRLRRVMSTAELTTQQIWGSFVPEWEEREIWAASWMAEDEELLKCVKEEFEAKRDAAAAAKLGVENRDGDTTAVTPPLNCPMCKRVFTGHKRECVARFQLPSPQSPSTLTTARCDCEMTSCGDVVLPYCLAPCGHSVCWDCLLCGNGECVICCVTVSGIVLNAGLCQLYGGDDDVDVRCSPHSVHGAVIPIEYLCLSDDSPLCSECRSENHIGADHNVLKLCACDGDSSGHSDACGMSLLSSQASSLCGELKAALKRAQSTLSSAEEKREVMLERKSSLIVGFEKRMDELIALIEAHKAKVIGELTAGFEEGLGELDREIDLLSTNVAQLSAAVTMHNHSPGLSLLGTLSSLKAMQGLVDSVKSCDDWLSNFPSASTCTLIDSVSLTGCVESALACMSVVVKDESYDDIDGVIVPGLTSLKASVERTVERWQLIRSLKRLRYRCHYDSECDASSEGTHNSCDVLASAFQAVSAILASNSVGEARMGCDDDELFLTGSVALCEAVIGLCGGVQGSDAGAVVVDWSVFGDDIGLIDVIAILLKLMSSHYEDVERRLVCSCAATALCSVIRTITSIDEVRVLFQTEHLCVWVEDSRASVARSVVSMLVRVFEAVHPLVSEEDYWTLAEDEREKYHNLLKADWLPIVSGLFKVIYVHPNKHDIVLSSLESLLHVNRICGVNVIGWISDANAAMKLMLQLLRDYGTVDVRVKSLNMLSQLALWKSDVTVETKADCVRAAVAMIELDWNDEAMVTAACQCLAAVCFFGSITSEFAHRERLFIVVLLTELLSLHGSLWEFVAAGVQTAMWMATVGSRFVKTPCWVELGTVDGVIACLRDWPNNEQVQDAGWEFVAAVIMRLPVANLTAEKDRLVNDLLAVIDDNLTVPEVQAGWLRREEFVPSSWHQSFACVIDVLQSIPRIFTAMDKHVGHDKIQRAACHALAWVAGSSEGGCAAIVAGGGLTRVFAAMDNHLIDAVVQLKTCEVLAKLAVSSVTIAERIVAEGGLTRILAAMDRHVYFELVQSSACWLLGKLAVSTVNADAIIPAGGLQRLYQAMEHYKDDSDVQQHGCEALGNLAEHASDKSWMFGEGGAFQWVCAVMGRFAGYDDKYMQIAGCRALWQLGDGNNAYKARIIAEGGLTRILAAMDKHVRKSDVQDEACWTLWNLVTDHSSNRVTWHREKYCWWLSVAGAVPQQVEFSQVSAAVITIPEHAVAVRASGGIERVQRAQATMQSEINEAKSTLTKEMNGNEIRRYYQSQIKHYQLVLEFVVDLLSRLG